MTHEDYQLLNTKITDLHGLINGLKRKVDDLNKIEIIVCNGKEKHIQYKRNEFFQMLYDKKNVWKEKARLTAKDVTLFGGIGFLIIDAVFKII